MYDVITVGSSTIDVFAGVESELIKIRSANHEEGLIAYPCGSKILIKELTFSTGGGGTNTAACFARLGFKVAYLGKVGEGTNSNLILSSLKKEGIKFLGVASRHDHSGYSIILDSLEGDRTILAYKGANDEFDIREINIKKLKTKWFYFSSMVNKSYEALEKLAQYAEQEGIKIAFNPSNYLAERGQLYLKEVLSRTHLLVLNREEAILLAGNLDIGELILKLQSFGPNIVVITDGKNGAYTVKGRSLLHVCASKMKPKETTGAGDAFASTFVAGLLKKKEIEYCLRMGLKNAESVISQHGAKSGLMGYKALLAAIRKSSPKIEKKALGTFK
jgi:ribokinase